MASIIILCYVLFIATLIHGISIHIDRLEMCDPNGGYPITFSTKLKTENGIQYVEAGSLTSKVDITNDVLATMKVYSLEDKEWSYVIGNEIAICDLREKYLGEFAVQIEKAAGLTATCPYPKGTYQISNYPLDWSILKHKDLPEGVIKVRTEFNNTKTQEFLGCSEIEVTMKK